MENDLPLSRRLDICSEEYVISNVPSAAAWKPVACIAPPGTPSNLQHLVPPRRRRLRPPSWQKDAREERDQPALAPVFDTDPAYSGEGDDCSPICIAERGYVPPVRSVRLLLKYDKLYSTQQSRILGPQQEPVLATFINSHCNAENEAHIFVKTDKNGVSTFQLGSEESTFRTVVTGKPVQARKTSPSSSIDADLQSMRRGLSLLMADEYDIAGDRKDVWMMEKGGDDDDGVFSAVEALFRQSDGSPGLCSNSFSVQFEPGPLGLTLEYDAVLDLLIVDGVIPGSQSDCDGRIYQGCILIGVGEWQRVTGGSCTERYSGRIMRSLAGFDKALRHYADRGGFTVYFVDRYAPEAIEVLGPAPQRGSKKDSASHSDSLPDKPDSQWPPSSFLEEERDTPFTGEESQEQPKWMFATGDGDFGEHQPQLLADRIVHEDDDFNLPGTVQQEEGDKEGPPAISLPLNMGVSESDDTPVFISFCNSHSKLWLQVAWLDYDSHIVMRRLLQPGDSYFEQSFVSHPWIARAVDPQKRGKEDVLDSSSRVAPGAGRCLTLRLGDAVAACSSSLSILWDPAALSLSVMSQASKGPVAATQRRSKAVSLLPGVDDAEGEELWGDVMGDLPTTSLHGKVQAAKAKVLHDMQMSRTLPPLGAGSSGAPRSGTPHVKLVMLGSFFPTGY